MRQLFLAQGETRLDCPVCKKTLIVVEYDTVEIDYCSQCGGMWLDAGELEMLLPENYPGRNMLEAVSPCLESPESTQRCPLCRKKMQKVRFLPEWPIIDKCPANQGLWLDQGELLELLGYHKADSSPITRFLVNLFSQGDHP